MANQQPDFANIPVPTEARKGNVWILAASSAWVIAVSTLYTGGALIPGLTLQEAIIAIIAGMAVITFIGYFMGRLGARYHVSTTILARHTFGTIGAAIFGIAMAVTLGFGWFAWQLSFFATTLQEMFGGAAWTNPQYTVVWVGILMILTAIGGFRWLSRLSIVAVPLILVVAAYGMFVALGISGFEGVISDEATNELTILSAITAVIGSVIFGSIILPDISRYSYSENSGGWSVSIGYALAGVIVMLAGAVMTSAVDIPGLSAAANVPAAMTALGLGFWAFVVLLLAQWTTNDSNLYSGSLGLAAVVPIPKQYLVAFLGVAGIIVASIGIENLFVPFLVFLGTFVPPIAGVMIPDYYLFRMRSATKPEFDESTSYLKINWFACIVVAVSGLIASYLVYFGGILGIASITSLIIAATLYSAGKFILNQ